MPAKRRSPGEGSTYRTKDGRLRHAMTITLPDGRTERKFLSAKTPRELNVKIAAARRQVEQGRIALDRMTLAQWLDRWLDDAEAAGEIRPYTLRNYEVAAGHCSRALGHIQLSALRPVHVQGWVTDLLREGYRGSTVRLWLQTVSRALNHAVDLELIPNNPARRIKAPRNDSPERRTLSVVQARRFMAHAEDAGDPHAPLWMLLVCTGLRLGEITGLRWSDLDLTTGILTLRVQLVWLPHGGGARLAPVKTVKGNRWLPLLPPARRALITHRRVQEARKASAGGNWLDEWGLVFTRNDGRPLQHGHIRTQFKAAIAAAGLPALTPHDMRHTAGTLMHEAGIDLKVISAWLGHASITITADRYTHMGAAPLEDAARRFTQLLGGDALEEEGTG